MDLRDFVMCVNIVCAMLAACCGALCIYMYYMYMFGPTAPQNLVYIVYMHVAAVSLLLQQSIRRPRW